MAFPFLHQILHTRLVDSPEMMRIPIRARGSEGMCPRIFFIKMAQSGAFLSVPKYVIVNLKLFFMDNFPQK